MLCQAASCVTVIKLILLCLSVCQRVLGCGFLGMIVNCPHVVLALMTFSCWTTVTHLLSSFEWRRLFHNNTVSSSFLNWVWRLSPSFANDLGFCSSLLKFRCGFIKKEVDLLWNKYTAKRLALLLLHTSNGNNGSNFSNLRRERTEYAPVRVA